MFGFGRRSEMKEIQSRTESCVRKIERYLEDIKDTLNETIRISKESELPENNIINQKEYLFLDLGKAQEYFNKINAKLKVEGLYIPDEIAIKDLKIGISECEKMVYSLKNMDIPTSENIEDYFREYSENYNTAIASASLAAGVGVLGIGGAALGTSLTLAGFSTAMVAIDIGEDLKKICEMKEKGIAKETIREEAEAMVYKVGVSFLSNMALIFPGGAAGSVAINYIGNKLIQKYFYSEISLQLRELRERNNEEDKIYKMLQEREKELNNLIEKFTVLVEETCNERKEVVNYLKNDFNSTSISNTSMKLTKKNIVKTSNEDIENLFKDELSI